MRRSAIAVAVLAAACALLVLLSQVVGAGSTDEGALRAQRSPQQLRQQQQLQQPQQLQQLQQQHRAQHQTQHNAPEELPGAQPEPLPAELAGCKVCCLHDRRAPRLYIKGQEGNGLGTNVHSMIYGMAIAAKYGMNFGGVVSIAKSSSSHGVDVHRKMADLFGFTNFNEIFLPMAPPMDAHFNDIQFIESSMFAFDVGRNRPGLRVMLQVSNLILAMDEESVRGWKQEDYLTPGFLDRLRAQAQPQLQARLRRFHPDGLKAPLAVLHVRRGDVSETREKSRMTPNAWYLSMIARIRRHWPSADVHVFSSTEGMHLSSEFDEFRAANATVHLDGDTLDDWAHFALAQVFVMAASSFSYAPALLNPNCVVYQLFPPGRFGDWMYSADQSRPTYEQEFGACIERAQRNFG